MDQEERRNSFIKTYFQIYLRIFYAIEFGKSLWTEIFNDSDNPCLDLMGILKVMF